MDSLSSVQHFHILFLSTHMFSSRVNLNGIELQRASNHRPTVWMRQTPVLRVNQNSDRSKKFGQLKSAGSASPGPLPLINHSNYLPQPQECAGRAAPWPLLRWETLRYGWQHQREQAVVHKILNKYKHYLYWLKIKIPLPTPLYPFSCTCNLVFIKTGSAKLSVIYLTRTLGKGPNLCLIQSSSETLILLCCAVDESCTEV